jgi:hypothetical protein
VAKTGITWTPNTLKASVAGFGPRLTLVLKGFFEYQESRVQDHMRANAPWTDRTANARQGLFAKAFQDGDNHGIVCYHTMPYGIWLEVKNSGQYAIIVPTIQTQGRVVMAQMNKLLAKMRVVA